MPPFVLSVAKSKDALSHREFVSSAVWRGRGSASLYEYDDIRGYERLIVRITLGLDPETARDVESYGAASVLLSLYHRLRGKDREVFRVALGNALEKNASRKALSGMVLFAANPVLDVDRSIDILADWFVKNRKADPGLYEALDAYWRRRFHRGFDEG